MGIELVCIDNVGYEVLTIGKNYTAIGTIRKVHGLYYFGLHNVTKDYYPVDIFLTKEEFRDKQLNKILDENYTQIKIS